MEIIIILIVGGLVGYVASLIVGGSGDFLIDIVIGCVGALLAEYLFHRGSILQGNFSIESLLIALVGAIILLFVVGLIRRGTANRQ